MEVEKLTASEYKAKLSLYRKEKNRPTLEENGCGKKIVLKRHYCEEYLVEDIDNL